MDCKHGNEIRQNNSCLKCSDEAVENILEIATSMADGSCFDHNDDICKHNILLTYANCKECDRELDERTEIDIEARKSIDVEIMAMIKAADGSCQWCGDRRDGFEEEHVSCQKAYQQGRQWAIAELEARMLGGLNFEQALRELRNR